MKLKELEIEGRELEVHVTPGGVFDVYPRGTDVEDHSKFKERICGSETLAGAEGQAKQRLKGKRHHVKVPYVNPESAERGEAYSLHAGNGDVMVNEGGERMRYRGSSAARGSGIMGRYVALRPEMSDEKRLRLLAIDDEVAALGAERDAIAKEFAFDLGRAVQDALREANPVDAS